MLIPIKFSSEIPKTAGSFFSFSLVSPIFTCCEAGFCVVESKQYQNLSKKKPSFVKESYTKHCQSFGKIKNENRRLI